MTSAETLPKEAFDDPSFKIADFIAAAGRGGGSSFTPSSSVPRQSEAWEMLEAVEEGFEEGSWKSAESGKEGTAVEGEFGLWGKWTIDWLSDAPTRRDTTR